MVPRVVIHLVLSVHILAVAGAAAAQSATASPTPPPQCVSTTLTRAWTAGRAKGEEHIQTAWDSSSVRRNLSRLNNDLPRVIERLQRKIVDLVERDVDAKVKCRAQGFVEGFFFRLNQLFGRCVLDGANWGQFAANVYCSLSLELGGLGEVPLFVRAPSGVCGDLFEYTCEDVYRYVGTEGSDPISRRVQTLLDRKKLVVAPFAECRAFTGGDFAPVFEAAVYNDCSYDVQSDGE
jgi:hypothetical protein